MQNVDIVIAKIGQHRGGFLGQRTVTLDGVDIGGNFGEDRCRVARTGTDFEHLLTAAERQRLGHECDDIGLRDRLPFLDRQGRVIVGKLVKLRRQKGFPWHAPHGIENQLGADAAREDGVFNHLISKLLEI